MEDKSFQAAVISLAEETLDEGIGCYLSSHEIYLIDNRGVLAEQIFQWLLIFLLPVATLVFVIAGMRAFRTHGCSFDSIVLFLCGVYNVIYIYEDMVHCSEIGQMTKILFVTAMILYLFFNFEKVLDHMEKEMNAQKRGISFVSGTSVGQFEATDMSPAYLTRSGSIPAQQPFRGRRASESERQRSNWRKCRRPFFWASLIVLFILLCDALFEMFLEFSILGPGQGHWVALRILDLILSISVFMQSKKLENLMDEKEELFLQQGYEAGELTSPFLKMRRKQLMIISYSYLASNMLVIVELIILFGVKDPALINCARICANPYTNAASLLLLSIAIIHLVPINLFLISFYIIPRRFNAQNVEEITLDDDLASNQEPLMGTFDEKNLDLMKEDNLYWQRLTDESADTSHHTHEDNKDQNFFTGLLNRSMNRLSGGRKKRDQQTQQEKNPYDFLKMEKIESAVEDSSFRRVEDN